MPTTTYFNLSSQKRQRIEDAVKKEFARVPLIDMSVKNIVNDASIARGSFYQYFETREDLINYMLGKEFNKESENFLKILQESNKDIFKATYEYLVQILDKQKNNSSYYINIFQYLNETKIQPLKMIDIDNISEYVNFKLLRISSKEEIYAAVRVIATLTFSKKMEILNGNISKEEGLKQYAQELEVIKRGIVK